MPRTRLHKTTADYLAIAISPALIMALVGSLAYFLLEVFYQGAFSERLIWITTCFVFAIVLIGRISMTEGTTYASMYMLALAAATCLAFMALVQNSFWALVVTAVIWFCAHHLTWNCTLVDDDQDATGEGLLEAAGLATGDQAAATDAADNAKSATTTAARPRDPVSAKTKDQQPRPSVAGKVSRWWRRYDSAKAPPGLWVVFFSLAALPIFGLGQLLIPAGDPARRRYVFMLVFVYVAAALGLLLSTAFLALRRYMRQRRLEMPTEMAGVWLAVGGAMIAAIMLAALLAPRPNAEYAVSSLGGSLESSDRDASWFAFLKSGGVDDQDHNAATRVTQDDAESPAGATTQDGSQPGGAGEGQASGPADSQASSQSGGQPPPGQSRQDGATQSSESSSSRNDQHGRSDDSGSRQSNGEPGQPGEQTSPDSAGKSSAADGGEQPGESSGGSRDAAAQGERQAGGSSSDQASADSQQAPSDAEQSNASGAESQPAAQESQPPQSFEPPSPAAASGLLSSLTSGMLPLLKLLLYAAAALFGGYLLIRYWREFVAWLAALRRALADLLASLFGGRRREATDDATPTAAGPRPRPFATYRNPFQSGDAGRVSPGELARYTFAALEAWANDHGQPRRDDETPLEFAARLAQETPLGDEVRDVARAYARVAYDARPLGDDCRPLLARFWKRMQNTAAAPQPIG